MPVIKSTYNPPHIFKNGFVSTVYSGLVRKIKGLEQTRERINTFDEDFIDLDWSFSTQKTNQLIILLHGLEGNAQRPYVTGTAKLFNENGFDAVCVNLRSCSGEENLKFKSYHSGATDDLEAVIEHIIATKTYTAIYINGFSLGGNLILKYLGERQEIPKQIKAAMAVSVPCDLHGSCRELHRFKNVLYHDRFKKHLKEKLKLKQQQYAHLISDTEIQSIKTLRDFDDVYTSKAHGFKDAYEYYEASSSLQFLHNITLPTLILNAQNDSFLSKECYPHSEAENNSNLYLEVPKHGGHVGFYLNENYYYNEIRALEFFKQF